ncbi:hypothetical protein ADUPG1_011928 [Aduncisulcus paluster]|uniref:Chromo domain-containing protein n=1 Tax=Aduncisulcus paluster TaxID=2918883 RepID=A0ABQ5JYF6_9EUKA|nr:hypothetical protein ADUPG1_011928 [Aduncisulcus paluster]
MEQKQLGTEYEDICLMIHDIEKDRKADGIPLHRDDDFWEEVCTSLGIDPIYTNDVRECYVQKHDIEGIDDEIYTVEKIISHKKIGGEYMYQVKWDGYDEISWIEGANFVDMAMVDAYWEDFKQRKKAKTAKKKTKMVSISKEKDVLEDDKQGKPIIIDIDTDLPKKKPDTTYKTFSDHTDGEIVDVSPVLIQPTDAIVVSTTDINPPSLSLAIQNEEEEQEITKMVTKVSKDDHKKDEEKDEEKEKKQKESQPIERVIPSFQGEFSPQKKPATPKKTVKKPGLSEFEKYEQASLSIKNGEVLKLADSLTIWNSLGFCDFIVFLGDDWFDGLQWQGISIHQGQSFIICSPHDDPSKIYEINVDDIFRIRPENILDYYSMITIELGPPSKWPVEKGVEGASEKITFRSDPNDEDGINILIKVDGKSQFCPHSKK